MKFKKGDRVEISAESEYYGQGGYTTGTIIAINPKEGMQHYYTVIFDNKEDNCYRDQDLILERINWEEHL